MNNLVEQIESEIHDNNSVDCSVMSQKSISPNPDSSNIDEYVKVIIRGKKISLRSILELFSDSVDWSISDIDVQSKDTNISEVSILAYKTKTNYDILYEDPPIPQHILDDIKDKYDNYVVINQETEEVMCHGRSTKSIMQKLDRIDYSPDNAILYDVNRID